MRGDYQELDREKVYLITGVAGFIGFHLAQRLLAEGCKVIGLDNLNAYYDLNLKKARLALIDKYEQFQFIYADIKDKEALFKVFQENKIDIVINLAAQAGVRDSLTNPEIYVQSNIVGFLNILEGCRYGQVEHLVYASSSAVYGLNEQLPFSVHDHADRPVSLYAATKRANELMAHTYSHLYGLPTTGLRFFTVYGPWGRPDMALFLFTEAILHDQPIKVFNHGQMKRDFTYIDDIVESTVRVLNNAPQKENNPPFKIYNIGNNQPVDLMEFIAILENKLGKKAKKEFLPLQPGDVVATYADVDDLQRDFGFSPQTALAEGIEKFIAWYKEFYCI